MMAISFNKIAKIAMKLAISVLLFVTTSHNGSELKLYVPYISIVVNRFLKILLGTLSTPSTFTKKKNRDLICVSS